MIDKELEKLLKDYNSVNKLPTSGYVSKTDSNGNKEWTHYRFHDTSWSDGPIGTIVILIVLVVGAIASCVK
jgi:hypothetical protein